MDATPRRQDAVNAHYGNGSLVDRMRDMLRSAGVEPSALRPEDVSGFEEFHIGGRGATRDLIELAEFGPGDRVLDMGCGIGGAARTLAREFGCQVVGLELTTEYCRAARWLNDRLDAGGAVEIREGDALDPPFEARAFEGVLLQHMAMNIPHKERLLQECHRVLRPGGRLALYEICAGEPRPIHFPVPWAEDPSLSHLVPPGRLRRVAEDAGFSVRIWEDVSASALDWFRGVLAGAADRPVDAPPPLGLNVLMGESTPTKASNTTQNLAEGRIRVVRAVLTA